MFESLLIGFGIIVIIIFSIRVITWRMTSERESDYTYYG